MIPFTLGAALLLCFPFIPSYGQSGASDSVIISGGPCIDSPISIISPIPATAITWMINGGTVVSKHTATKTTDSVVAGGGGNGSSASQFSLPDRLYVDAYGNMYIPDYLNNRVQKWSVGATSGITVAGGNGQGKGANQLNFPSGVTVDAQGNIFVADQGNDRVQKWAPGATSGVTVAGLNRELEEPTDMFIDTQGSLYVSSQFGGCVFKYTPDFSQWTVVAGIRDQFGTDLSHLFYPTGIYVDAAGNVYVSDTQNSRIMKWQPGATSGIIVAGGNGYGNAANQLAYPHDVTVDCQGDMYIADFDNNRIQLWTAGATSGSTIIPSGSNLNQVSTPSSVYLDGDGFVYISDAGNERIQRYGYEISRKHIPTSAGIYTAIVNTGCGIVISNPIIIYSSTPPLLPADTSLCPDSQLQLNVHSSYTSYQWQNGSTDSIFTVKSPGTYSVKVTSLCGGPFSAATVVSMDKPPAGFLPLDTGVCSNGGVFLKPTVDFTSYLWSDGSTEPSITVNQPGLYWLEGTDKSGCKATDSVSVSSKACPPVGVYVPSAFTPNGDGRNDVFRPKVFGVVRNYSFSVYDRYGQLVFSSRDPGLGWDGKVGVGRPNSNVFVWYCSFQLAGQPIRMEKGTVVLVR